MTRYILVFLFIAGNNCFAQKKSLPVASFSFNDKKGIDDVNKLKAKLVGVNHISDRFGNENNAIFLSGNEYSYLNLGTSKLLKSKAGSISLWVKIEHPVWSGEGLKCNPIIVTKNCSRDDFYESFAIYYMLESKRLVAVCAKDSTKDIGTFSTTFSRNKWSHLVISYDNDYLLLYINGNLEGKFDKKFETHFLESDSVMIGVSANKKNNRWLNGCVDDIAFYDCVLTQEEVTELYNAPNPNKNKIILNWCLIGGGILLFLIVIFFSIKYYIKITLEKGKQRLELANTILENELRINRALMNPHFVFNSLNTLNHYILTNKNEIASDYLVKFSKLIRRILDSNMSDTISLEQEFELIHGYLEIESMRFKEDIKYELKIDPAIIPSNIIIPIMMVQPFIENSVWHGLRDKTGDKIISVSFSLLNANYIECVIDDNGTGRKKKEPNSTEKKSLATGFVQQRLALLNKIHKVNCSLIIIDKENNSGTIVKLILPILNN